MIEEPVVEHAGPRRRGKNRAAQMVLGGCGSPRNVRRSRRRSEVEVREEKELEEIVKPRKKRQSGKSKKEKMSLVPVPAPSSLPPTPSMELIRLYLICVFIIASLVNIYGYIDYHLAFRE